jgi:hypothetical protein
VSQAWWHVTLTMPVYQIILLVIVLTLAIVAAVYMVRDRCHRGLGPLLVATDSNVHFCVLPGSTSR